ncbi:DNA-binding XRE family transcriptional regulator [Sphingomonas vulcanisoli]|uniref:DNA-binding XRE family transcriptional regulator n=1 Tax=Sphingomonas vulcanisoli TaxID=1658060 RepID=A0ABX0TTI9_9SPHN|nr:helix-turn-helix transcriptional regulator [Sphingomonas vulcanisoli]NIJ08054.1 DNA-binding XRE family transcriptional regulator [Sphingomonas vulcanisoli]
MLKNLPQVDEDLNERETLLAMLAEARTLVQRLETALWRLNDPDDRDANPVLYWRRKRRISQSELARMVGVTAAAICRIEHAAHVAARPETLKGISAALNVPVEWLTVARPIRSDR